MKEHCCCDNGMLRSFAEDMFDFACLFSKSCEFQANFLSEIALNMGNLF